MTRILVLSFIFLLPTVAMASDPIPKSAPNCNIDLPPNEAGEDAVHATLIKIFPRKSSVVANYSGCQTAWLHTGQAWEKFSVMYFKKGQLRTWLSSENGAISHGIVCQYSNGKLEAKQPPKCYVPTAGLKSTFAPGCMAEMIESGRMDESCNASFEH